MNAALDLPAGLRRERLAGFSLLRREGRGGLPPVLLLHGIGSDAATWAPLIAALEPRAEVVAPDSPGYGASDPVAPESPAPADYAAAFLRLADALGWPRFVLVGHSLGCLFAGALAVANPARVAALALFSPALGYAVPQGAPLPPKVQARIDDLAALDPAEFAARRAARLLHRAEEKPSLLEGVRRAMGAVNLPGYAQAVRALGAGDLLADAPRLALPTLVAVGAEDVVTPPENARRLWDTLPQGWRHAEVPEAGHALPQEAPAALAALIGALAEEVA